MLATIASASWDVGDADDHAEQAAATAMQAAFRGRMARLRSGGQDPRVLHLVRQAARTLAQLDVRHAWTSWVELFQERRWRQALLSPPEEEAPALPSLPPGADEVSQDSTPAAVAAAATSPWPRPRLWPKLTKAAAQCAV